MRSLFRGARACVVALALLAGEAGSARADVTVTLGNFYFDPAEVTIFEGDTVVWVWTEGSHSTTSDDCMCCSCTCTWDSGVQSDSCPPFVFQFTFDTAGDYDYYCQPHFFLGMTGTVHVLPAPGRVAARKAADRPSGLALLGVGLCGCGLCGYARYRRLRVV
jgi:plastocyanin